MHGCTGRDAGLPGGTCCCRVAVVPIAVADADHHASTQPGQEPGPPYKAGNMQPRPSGAYVQSQTNRRHHCSRGSVRDKRGVRKNRTPLYRPPTPGTVRKQDGVQHSLSTGSHLRITTAPTAYAVQPYDCCCSFSVMTAGKGRALSSQMTTAFFFAPPFFVSSRPPPWPP